MTEERELRQELLNGPIVSLRKKQDIWEHPRNIAILIGATAALVGAGAGFLGFKLGQTPTPQIIIRCAAADPGEVTKCLTQ